MRSARSFGRRREAVLQKRAPYFDDQKCNLRLTVSGVRAYDTRMADHSITVVRPDPFFVIELSKPVTRIEALWALVCGALAERTLISGDA